MPYLCLIQCRSHQSLFDPALEFLPFALRFQTVLFPRVRVEFSPFDVPHKAAVWEKESVLVPRNVGFIPFAESVAAEEAPNVVLFSRVEEASFGQRVNIHGAFALGPFLEGLPPVLFEHESSEVGALLLVAIGATG